MVSLSSASSSTRYLQVGLSACVLGLSATVLKQRGTLSSMTDTLSTYYQDNSIISSSLSTSNTIFLVKRKRTNDDDHDGDDDLSSDLPVLNLDVHWKSNAISLASSSISIFSNSFNYFTPKLISKGTKSSLTAKSLLSSFSTTELLSVGSLVSSEVVSQSLWSVSSIISLAKYGSWDCGSVESLLTQYNLTGDTTTTILENFYNSISAENDSASSANLTTLEQLLESADNENITSANLTSILSDLMTELNGIDGYSSNTTVSELQSNLLIALSENCQIKKATLSTAILTWFTYIITSGSVTASAVTLINSWKKTKNSIKDPPNMGFSGSEPNSVSENQSHDFDFTYKFKRDWLLPTLEISHHVGNDV